MRNYKLIFLAVILLGFIGLGVKTVTKANNKLKLKDIQIQSKQSDLLQTELKFQQLNTNLQKELEAKTLDQEKIKQLEEEKKQLQEKEQKLQAELQAKAKTKADEQVRIASAASKAVGVQKAYAASGNFYKDFIYQHESGNRTTAVNSIGCRGLGQACPGTKLPCGDDYACQDAWFTNYAMTRYGSWEAAYNWWTVHRWW